MATKMNRADDSEEEENVSKMKKSKKKKKRHKEEGKGKAAKKEKKKERRESKKRRHEDGDDDDGLKKKTKKKSKATTNTSTETDTITTTTKTKLPFDHDYIVAPMVGASELPFRLLTRKYGSQLCYTPMMSAPRFVREPAYRHEIFQTNALDRPLVCHFHANDPDDFAKAVQLCADDCDAVDLNLGCPQRTAFLGHFGSYLLDPGPDRQLICDIVRAGATAVSPPKPILVKIRLLSTLEETIELCLQLQQAGASLIAIHARHRASWERKGPGARDGPAKLDFVTQIKRAVPGIPIIANGNVITYEDVIENRLFTNADGIMSAEGILDNPALFLPRLGKEKENENDEKTIAIVDPLLHCTTSVEVEGDGRSKAEQKVIDNNPSPPESTTTTTTSTSGYDGNRKKEKRKLLKKLREIERIQDKVKQNGGEDSILDKDQKQKLQAKESVQDAIHKLEQLENEKEKKSTKSCRQEEKRRRNGTTKSEPQQPSSSSSEEQQQEVTVANTTNTLSLSQLYASANDKIELAQEYLQLAQRYGPTTMRTQIFHVRRMMKETLDQYQLMPDCLACTTPQQLAKVVQQCRAYRRNPTLFVYDREKAKEQALALERKRREEGKRKAFEARMIRKAKREGKLHDLEFYLRQGAAVPTNDTIRKLKAMQEDDKDGDNSYKQRQLKAWTQQYNHSQHCLAYHLEGKCQRGRSCAFLHVDAIAGTTDNGSKNGHTTTTANTSFEEQDEVAG